MPVMQCPEIATLRKYSLGDFSDEEGEAIESHLENCPTCEETLADFDDTSDSLVRHLPLTGQQESSPKPSGWLKRLMSGPPDEQISEERVNGSTSHGDDLPGQLGAYELTGVLGKGGMGVVYAARHRQLGRDVAIKVVSPKLMSARQAQRRFDREIRVLGGLNHAGIVTATDAGNVGGAAFLVMERIEGVDLSTLVRKTGPLEVGEACSIAKKIALALDCAHRAGAVHRDVKPSNVMLDRNGQVKLLDFGLAHLSESLDRRGETSLGQLLGTLDYMAPEQAEGTDVGPAVDLYGIGATLFFLLTGRPPRVTDRDTSIVQQIRALTEEEPPLLKDVRADVPAELSELCATLLSRDPHERPADLESLASEFDRWIAARSEESLQELVSTIPLPSGSELESRSEVQNSLSELFGTDSENPLAASITKPQTQTTGGSNGRRGWWFLAGLGGLFAAIYFGIILLIETPEGTLEIESEVAGIEVELMQEEEHVKTLKIEAGLNATDLKAGKYRIRLAKKYDTLFVTPEVIELRSDGEALAKIRYRDRVPKSETETDDDRKLYQGEPAAVWRKRFSAETNPVAKIEAGSALITLGNHLPEQQRLEQLLHVGGELIESGWGTDADDYFDYYGLIGNSRFSPERWSKLGYPKLAETWLAFYQVAETVCETIPPEQLAEELANTIENSTSPQAIFATVMLISSDNRLDIEKSQVANETVLGIRVRVESDLSLHLNIAQAEYYEKSSSEAQQKFAEYSQRVIEHRINRRLPENQSRMIEEWFDEGLENQVNLSSELRCRVALKMLLVDPDETLRDLLQGKWMSTGEFAYPDGWIKPARQNLVPWCEEWIPVACAYLREHPEDSRQTADVLQSFDILLRCRAKEDDWNMPVLIETLTDRLRTRYETAEQKKSVVAAYHASTHDLLSWLVLAGGAIPEFVLTQDQPITDPQKFAQFQSLIHQNVYWDEFQKEAKQFEDLILTNPFQTVAAVIRDETPMKMESGNEARGYKIYTMGLTHPLRQVSTRGNGDESPPPIEPLLLLAIATELTGVSEAQDDRIATLWEVEDYLDSPEAHFARHIDDALEYPLVIRPLTEKYLRTMYARATSDLLKSRIEKLLPELKQSPEAVRVDHSVIAAVKKYNAESAPLREKLFEHDIPDITVEQLLEAFSISAKVHRENGEARIAERLQKVVESKDMGDLELFRTGTTNGPQNDPIARQIVPGMTIQNHLVPLRSLELMYSRDGYSSKYYGDINPPIDGTWKLTEVDQEGKTLTGKELSEWLDDSPGFRQLVIAEDKLTLPFQQAPEKIDGKSPPDDLKTYDLSLQYNGYPNHFTATKGEVVVFDGIFSTDAFVADTRLTLGLPLENGLVPDSFNTEKNAMLKLTYERQKASGENAEKNQIGDAEPESQPDREMKSDPERPEFPPVKVMVTSESGQPLAGAKIEFTMLQTTSKPVNATDISKKDGVVFDRVLPYGKYKLKLTTREGWVNSWYDVIVEFGGGLDLNVVAPNPDEQATLVIENRFSRGDLEGLRFGSRQVPSGGNSYLIGPSPEPGKSDSKYTSFPTVENGIEDVALALRVRLSQEIEQPDGTTETWHWNEPGEDQSQRFLLTKNQVRPIRDSDGEKSVRRAETGYFVKGAGSANRYNVGYVRFTLGEPIASPLSLKVPAGDLMVLLSGPYGRPDKDVLEALDPPEKNEGDEFWLSTEIPDESAWIPRLLNVENWIMRKPKSGVFYAHLVRREETLKAGESLTIKIEPPAEPDQ